MEFTASKFKKSNVETKQFLHDVSTTYQQPSVAVIDLPEASIHRPPKDYLIISVLNSIFCCICLGIPALIFSVKTKEATKYGHIQKAFEYSRKSMKFNILAFVLGLIAIITLSFFNHILFNHILYNRNPHYDNRYQRPYNSGFGGPNGGGF